MSGLQYFESILLLLKIIKSLPEQPCKIIMKLTLEKIQENTE